MTVLTCCLSAAGLVQTVPLASMAMALPATAAPLDPPAVRVLQAFLHAVSNITVHCVLVWGMLECFAAFTWGIAHALLCPGLFHQVLVTNHAFTLVYCVSPQPLAGSLLIAPQLSSYVWVVCLRTVFQLLCCS